MTDELIKKLLSYLESAEFLIKENTSDIFNEAISYYYYDSLIGMGVSLFLIFICFSIFFYMHLKCDIEWGLKFIFLSILIMFLMMFLSHTDNMIKIKSTPRYFLIKKISQLRE